MERIRATKKSNKTTTLDTEYTKRRYAEFRQQQRQLISRKRRLATIFVGVLVVFAIIGVQIFHDMQRMHQLNELRVEANIEVKEVSADVDQLHQDVSLLKDGEYVARLIRSKFLYSRSGKKVCPTLKSNTDSSTNEVDQSTSSTTAK